MQYINRQYPLSEEEKQVQETEREVREKEQQLSNNRLGVTVFQVSWLMAFIALSVVYWQLGFSEGWRPSPDLAPDILPPILATVTILISGFFARRAWKIVEQTEPDTNTSSKPAFQMPWLIAIAFGIIFFGIMMQQFFSLPFSNEPEYRFSVIYALMIGYHALHALVTLIMMGQVYRLGSDHRYNSKNYWAIEGSSKLWYFVIVAWLLFYAVLYTPFLS